MRDHMWSEYGSEIQKDVRFFESSGFWTGYVRFYNRPDKPRFHNMYSGVEIPREYYTPHQPDDLRNNDISFSPI